MNLLIYYFLLLIFVRTWASQPNILFIIADDLGYHDVGYHGADIKTPNIDQVIEILCTIFHLIEG